MDPAKILGFPQDRLFQLQDDSARYMQKMRELVAERNALKERNAVTEVAKLGLEKQNGELIEKIDEMNTAMVKLMSERDTYKAWEQQYLKDCQKLQEENNIVLSVKNRTIHNQRVHLNEELQKYDDRLKVLKEQHVHQIEDMDLELKTLKSQQEQHAKELNEKDLIIQELEARLSAAEQKNVDQLEEFTNEKNRLSLFMQKLQEEFLKADQRLQDVRMMLKRQKEEVVSEPTKLHIELGKLYLELQEAKKPQEALMARLAAKNQGIEYLTKQHEEKLAAKDSEIQNLTWIVQDGEKKNENLEEIIASLRKTMYVMEWEMEEMEKKFKAEKGEKLAAKDSEIRNLTEKNENLQEIISNLHRAMTDTVEEGEKKDTMVTNLWRILFAKEHEMEEMKKKTKKGAE